MRNLLQQQRPFGRSITILSSEVAKEDRLQKEVSVKETQALDGVVKSEAETVTKDLKAPQRMGLCLMTQAMSTAE